MVEKCVRCKKNIEKDCLFTNFCKKCCGQDIIENKYRKKIKDLKTEVSNLNMLLLEAGESDWDMEDTYRDFRDGRLNGADIEYGKPNKKLASWFAKRHNLNEKELEDG